MKNMIKISALILAIAPFAAQASCDSVKEEIAQKIINNGVPESGFTLTVVPSSEAEQAGGQIVGNCDNESQKIIYVRK